MLEPAKEILEGARKIGEDRLAFRKMLEKYVPLTSYNPPKKPRILNLGCDVCYEAHVLSSYFGNQPDGWDSKDVLVVGVDLDEKKIRRARIDYQTLDTSLRYEWTKKLSPNYNFIHEDAMILRELVDMTFDVVVARHPNVDQIPDDWRQIFEETRHVVNSENLFIGTSYSDIEHKTLEELIKEIGYYVILSVRNPYAIPTGHKEVSFDRKVLFAKIK